MSQQVMLAHKAATMA
jgi:hypothetical protein